MVPPSPEKTNAVRALESRSIPYEVFTFPAHVHSAAGVAAELGVPAEQVYKTLVLLRPNQKPFLVLTAGERKVDLKRVAKALGEKRVRMAAHREAETITGLRVGGISALALLARRFPVLIDRPVLNESHVLVSAGKRGINLRVAVRDLIEVTAARIIDATG